MQPQISKFNNHEQSAGVVKDRILIVDDDEFNIFTVKGIINRHYYVEMDEAYNGEIAVQKVLQTGPNNYYKAIFMDCSMPKMNGFQATKAICERVAAGEIPPVKIIGASAFTDDFKKECLNAGMNDFITKPLSIEAIKKSLIGMGFKPKEQKKKKNFSRHSSSINCATYNILRDNDEEERIF